MREASHIDPGALYVGEELQKLGRVFRRLQAWLNESDEVLIHEPGIRRIGVGTRHSRIAPFHKAEFHRCRDVKITVRRDDIRNHIQTVPHLAEAGIAEVGQRNEIRHENYAYGPIQPQV